jgi:hypothetical protein
MKWILLVYILTANPQFEAVDGLTEEFTQRRLQFPVEYAECELMAAHINYMMNYIRITPFPFVKSLYFEHTRNGDKVLARCIYTDPDNIPNWTDDFLK